MKVLSLFDGISIARYSLELAGIEVDKYYASEIDKYAIQTSEKNYPDIIRLGDVKNVDGKDYQDVDLLIAGFPCQSFSIAGHRKGLEDERGQLVFELIRILKEVKPKHIILENVASMKKEIQEYLREEFSKATGKEVYINKINASLVSAQNRNRIFFTFQEIPQPEDRGILLKDILEDEVDEKYFIKDYKTKWNSDKPIDTDKDKYKVLRVGGDTPTIRLGQIGAGGQADRIYSQPESIKPKGNYLQIRKITPIECERLQSLKDGFSSGVSDTQRYKQCGNGFNAEVVAHIIKHLLN